MRKLAAWFLSLISVAVAAQTPSVAPRTVTDIVAMLEQHRFDPVRTDELRARLKTSPPQAASPLQMARFFQERATTAQQLGEERMALEDFRRGLELVRGSGDDIEAQLTQSTSGGMMAMGDFVDSIALLDSLRNRSLHPGRAITVESARVFGHGSVGDREGARAAYRGVESAWSGIRGIKHPVVQALWPWYEGVFHLTTAYMLALENKYTEAEQFYLRAIPAFEKDIETAKVRVQVGHIPGSHTPEAHVLFSIFFHDRAEMSYAFFLLELDRVREAEIAVRNVFSRLLARLGRYHTVTANGLRQLGRVLYQQGRYSESAALARMAVETLERLQVARHSVLLAEARRVEAQSLAAQRRWAEAVRAFEAMRAGLATDPETLKRWRSEDIDWVLALVGANRAAEAVPMAETLVARESERRGKDNLRTGTARGGLALALFKSGARERAQAEFEEAARVIALETANDVERSPARVRQVQEVLEGYIQLLIEKGDAARAFMLADIARGQSVQRALAASAARAAVNDPDLAQIARKEQDLEQELRSLYSFLSNMLGAPPAQRLPKVEADMRKRIETISEERKALLADMTRRFPRYAELLNPRAPSVEDARKSLHPGEALVSVLVTQERTFVWALPQKGEVVAAAVPLGSAEADRIVAKLRSALEPEEALLARFSPFDVAAAHGLYERLLKPVEAGWKGAHTLLVAANGALGRLPFAVLPTAPMTVPAGGLLFSGYRDVPWLGKQVAMAQLPSVSSLVTLRSSPSLKADRAPFAGFGDPLFDRKKVPAQTAAGESRLRSLKLVTRADGGWTDYAELTPLPDTRDEVLAIARTLGADAKDVYLGAEATRKRVKSTDLSNHRVVAFATHGLIPGDLPGLYEPALALAAPEDPKDNPLLTLEDVLGLKLNADWVVLSACNTASGDGEGAEAVSGLGRGFFYAGTRALLVTHWPVESRSARILVTKLFERYAADPAVSRAEALKHAILAVMQESGDGADGKPYFSYAHPLFWAPYTLVGDASR